MLEKAQRHKSPNTLGEPFRTFRESELNIEKARAMFCFFQHTILKRSLRDMASEQGVTHERVRQLCIRAKVFYGVNEVNYEKLKRI